MLELKPLVKLKLPLPSNVFVTSRVQLERARSTLVEVSTMYWPFATPFVPFTMKSVPDTVKPVMMGKPITFIVPSTESELVSQARPTPSGGKMIEVNEPLRLAQSNRLNVSPDCNGSPMFVTTSAPPYVEPLATIKSALGEARRSSSITVVPARTRLYAKVSVRN